MSFRHPFPAIRPAVSIAESDNKITQLDLPELQWWPIIPTLGDPTPEPKGKRPMLA